MGLIKILIVLVLLALAAYGGFVYGQIALQNNFLEVQVPIKQDVNFTLEQEIVFPLRTTIEIPINKTIFIKKTIPIETSIALDTIVNDVPVEISGSIVYVDIPIKTNVPVKTSININEPVIISEDVPFFINQNFSIPVKKYVIIPIDTVVKTKVPLPWNK